MTTVPDSTTEQHEAGPDRDPGGPMVGVCDGGRCAALWRLADGATPDTDAFDTGPLRAVRGAIATTPGGVLSRLECVGACAQAPLIGVADRRPDRPATGQVTWLVGAAATERQAGLLAWLGDDWTDGAPPAPARLLPALHHMVRATRT